MAAYTFSRWLRGMVDYDIPADTIAAILFNNQVPEDALTSDVPERERDLCLADLLMWLSSSSKSSSGEIISDGGWSHQKSNKQVVDHLGLIKRAQALYAKWDSDKAKSAVRATITVKPIY